MNGHAIMDASDALYLVGGIAASAAAVLGAIAHRRARACERLRRAHGVDDTAPVSRMRRWLASSVEAQVRSGRRLDREPSGCRQSSRVRQRAAKAPWWNPEFRDLQRAMCRRCGRS